jgi:hypothetical protein
MVRNPKVVPVINIIFVLVSRKINAMAQFISVAKPFKLGRQIIKQN